jgi:thioredoxin reductase
VLDGQQLVWGISLLIVAAIVLPYLWRFHRRHVVDRERKAEAARLGIDRPRAQYPWIDPTHCVGCAACVHACPEGDVLGVVGGTAVVINGLRCVGHSACEEVCPVGAITVGLGDLRSRKDMPLLDEHLQTTVPGIYIVGELGGLSLVKNAIVQGRQVIEGIVGRGGPSGSSELLDVAIVGAGPSGLSAALSAKAAGLSYRVIEKEEDLGGSLLHYPRRKMVLTQPVELPPWGKLDKDEYAKEALLEIFSGILDSFGLEILFGHPVTGVERRDGFFEIDASGETLRARHVVLALGRRGSPRKLGVPGEELPKVMYRLIDAESYNDERILVVGGGDSAIEAAVALACQPGNEVTLSYRKEKLVRVKKKNQDKIEPLFESGAVRPAMPSQVASIARDSVLLTHGDAPEPEELGNDYVFVFAGGVPPFGFLQQIGVQFGGEG